MSSFQPALSVLFEKKHRGTLNRLCDVLNVTSPGDKVPRWVVIGRNECGSGFDHMQLKDARAFLEWAASGPDRLTWSQLNKGIAHYAGSVLLQELNTIKIDFNTTTLPFPAASSSGSGNRKKGEKEKPSQATEIGSPPDFLQKSCVICMVTPSNHVYIPCGHLVTCETCTSKVQQCPMCRSEIAQRVKVFIS